MNETTKTQAAPPRPDAVITRMELTISTLLRAGILTSLVLVLTGVAVTLVRHPEFATSTEALNYLKTDHYKFPTHLGDIFKGVLAGQGRAIVLLGVFVLFLTPVLRVTTSIIGYVLEKDWAYTAITSVVLFLLCMSLVLGKAH